VDVALTGRDGVVEMGDCSDIPRVACHGACEEGGGVVNEVGNDHFDEVLREFCDWGRAIRRCLWGTSVEQPLDFG